MEACQWLMDETTSLERSRVSLKHSLPLCEMGLAVYEFLKTRQRVKGIIMTTATGKAV
jgi:hypothetical protein